MLLDISEKNSFYYKTNLTKTNLASAVNKKEPVFSQCSKNLMTACKGQNK